MNKRSVINLECKRKYQELQIQVEKRYLELRTELITNNIEEALKMKELLKNNSNQIETLSFFKIAEKQRLKKEINVSVEKILTLLTEQGVEHMMKEYYAKGQILLNNYKKELDTYISNLFPYEKMYRIEESNLLSGEDKEQFRAVLKVLKESGEALISEITEKDPIFQTNPYPSSRVSAICRKLESDGYLKRRTHNGNAFFSINEQGIESIIKNKLADKGITEDSEDINYSDSTCPALPVVDF